MVWFLIRSIIMWPFVLQFSSSPFDFGLLPFWWVPSLVRSILVTLRHIYFLQCSSFGEVDFIDLETRFDLLGNLLWCSRFCWLRGINLFLAVYFLVKSISLTSRHDFVSLFGCPRLDEADFVDLEVLIYFLQCTSFGGVDRFDPEARIFAVHLLQWSRSLWPWGTNLFLAVDHSLTSRLWACWKLLLHWVHWHVFVCASEFLLSPWNGFQHQKGLCETKHSPAWAMANMVPMWPQDSCFSPVVAGVGGLPFRWHDAGLPQWSLQIRNSELLNLWNSETGYFLSGTLSFSSLILEVIDYFWLLLTLPITCPNNRTW